MKKKAIIIGATSGIGKALAKSLSEEGYVLGLTGRRLELLETLRSSLPNDSIIKQMDVADTDKAERQFGELVKQLERVNLVIISAGIGHINLELDPALEQETIGTNVAGFTTLAAVAFAHFKEHKEGHLVGISSVLALRGSAAAPAYSASKAFVSNYMEGLRLKAIKEKLDITVTDVRPGYVDTAMARGNNMFWVASAEKAAQQILRAIKLKKSCAYVTRRWQLVAWLIKFMPNSLYKSL